MRWDLAAFEDLAGEKEMTNCRLDFCLLMGDFTRWNLAKSCSNVTNLNCSDGTWCLNALVTASHWHWLAFSFFHLQERICKIFNSSLIISTEVVLGSVSSQIFHKRMCFPVHPPYQTSFAITQHQNQWIPTPPPCRRPLLFPASGGLMKSEIWNALNRNPRLFGSYKGWKTRQKNFECLNLRSSLSSFEKIFLKKNL